MEAAELDLNARGNVKAPKIDKTLIIDADTIIFSTCISMQEVTEVSPDMYEKDVWKDIVLGEGFNAGDMTLATLDVDEALRVSIEKVEFMMEATGCSDVELHFTSGRESFRYKEDPDYKDVRTKDKTKLPPVRLGEVKELVNEHFKGKSWIWKEWEADDAVVGRFLADPDNCVIAAVDKDVLYSTPGTHYNYYESALYKISPKWVTVTEDEALRYHYQQVLTGDASDGVIGLKGIGPAKAKKALGTETDTHKLWDSVVKLYKEKGRTEGEAILNMVMVNMRQVSYDMKTKEYTLKIWTKECL